MYTVRNAKFNLIRFSPLFLLARCASLFIRTVLIVAETGLEAYFLRERKRRLEAYDGNKIQIKSAHLNVRFDAAGKQTLDVTIVLRSKNNTISGFVRGAIRCSKIQNIVGLHLAVFVFLSRNKKDHG